MSRSIPLWTSSKNWAIHHHRVVGTSSHKTSDTDAVYTKEKQYIKNRVWSVTAEQEYVERRNSFPRSGCIHHDIAQAKFRSKLDMTEAYEQMHIRPEDVKKMTFSTIFGTFQSQVMQMGDCNAPSIFQQLMTTIFWDFLGRFVHIYLDDIFIYSQSIQEHIEHIIKVLQQLRESQFYLSRSKLDLFSDKTDCLGHVIDDNGIHAELDKMWRIREWIIPQKYNEVQKFLGLVQYLALYMPDITAYTTLWSGSAQNNQTFQWTPLLDKCFQSIKAIAMWSPILKPVDFNKNEPVWVIMDSSWMGIGVMYGQGANWRHMSTSRISIKEIHEHTA